MIRMDVLVMPEPGYEDDVKKELETLECVEQLRQGQGGIIATVKAKDVADLKHAMNFSVRRVSNIRFTQNIYDDTYDSQFVESNLLEKYR